MDKKYPVSKEIINMLECSDVMSAHDFADYGFRTKEHTDVLVDDDDNLLIFRHKNMWRCVGTNDF